MGSWVDSLQLGDCHLISPWSELVKAEVKAEQTAH